MKRLLYLSILMLLGFNGCNRRPLDDEVGGIALVPVSIDWSKSNLQVEDISRVTVRVFPHDGSPAYNFVMQESKTDDVIPLVVGKYSFVIFNETTDPNDWNSLVFRDAEKYDTFLATTGDDAFRGLLTKAEGDIIRKSPDPLAVFSLDEFEVTREMVNYTRALSRGEPFPPESSTRVEQEMARLTRVVPLSAVKYIHIVAHVENLVSAKRSSGVIRGAAGAVQMSTSKPIAAPVTHVFIMNGRKYDNPEMPKDGTIGALVVVFDPSTLEDLKAELGLDFLLYDDSVPPMEVFDITNDLKTDEKRVYISIDHIVLPIIPLGGDNIGVDDWDDIIVPLK